MNRTRQIRKSGCRYMGSSGMSLATLKKKEMLYIALFLYVADHRITEAHEEIESETLLFLDLCKYFGVTDKLERILAQEIINAENEGRIEIEDKKIRSSDYGVFPFTHYRFKYRIDERIAESIPDEFSKDSDSKRIRLFIDLYRTIISAKDDKEFQRIIYSLFFGKGKLEDLKYHSVESLPKRIRNLAYHYPMLEFVKENANLSILETAYLNMMFYIDQVPIFRSFIIQCGELQSDIFIDFLGITSKEFNMLNRRAGNLKQHGFLMEDGFLDYDLKEAIINQSMDYYYNDIIKPYIVEDSYDLKSFSISREKTELLTCFLNGTEPCNILFHGAAGAGKTEYAKTLAGMSNKKTYIYRNETEIQGSKILAKINAFLSLSQKDSLLIIDEADKLLSTVDRFGIFGITSPNSTKGIVNKLLDNSQSKAIWIVNYDNNIDESTKRRFTISHRFDPMTESQLRSIASEKLEVLKLKPQLHNKILDLFGKYKVSGSSVDNVIKGLKSIGHENSERYAEMILKENSELQYGRQKMRETVNDESYDLSIVNASTPAAEIIQMIENALAYSEKHPEKKNGIRMLFYGASGTGKTELVRKISQQIGKSICLKRASDILDKYVGESEKKIADAFSECERNGSILLFDEADSFFADRNQAAHNWERTTVNEFLTQMEEFGGILICTTNLRNIMDPAMQRRFHALVEFKPLTESGIKTLLEKYFPDFDFSQEQVSRIAVYDSATPGDFASLEGKIRFLSSEKINADFLIEELENLQKEKNGGTEKHRSIGFIS